MEMANSAESNTRFIRVPQIIPFGQRAHDQFWENYSCVLG
jgi:hypothetical protein